MTETEALLTIDQLLLEMNATYGNRLFPLQPERLPVIRKRWAKTLIHSTPERIVQAFEMFVVAGSDNPPTLPAFRKAVDDLEKQSRLQIDHKAIEGRMTRSAANQGFQSIREILK